ncbi:hypothetical protein AAMO2058_001321600 [Amorphochlora amoebiformis]
MALIALTVLSALALADPSANKAKEAMEHAANLKVRGQQLLKLEAPCDFSCCPCARYSYTYYPASSSCTPCDAWRSQYVEPEYYPTCSAVSHVDQCGYYGSDSYVSLVSPYRVYPTLSYQKKYHGNDHYLSSLYFPPSTSHFVYADAYGRSPSSTHYYHHGKKSNGTSEGRGGAEEREPEGEGEAE